MKLNFDATHFYVNAVWTKRQESAESVADRYVRFIDAVTPLHPLLSDWIACGKRKPIPFATARRDLVKIVQERIDRDDDGTPEPRGGYGFSAYTREEPGFELRGRVGRDYSMPDLNRFQFSTTLGYWPKPSMITFDLFRLATLATIACWKPLFCSTQSSTLQPHMAPRTWFHASWFTYVHPSLVHRVASPNIPVVESTPDGGLLLGAASETFDVSNPAHLAAALSIENATRHLDDVMPPL